MQLYNTPYAYPRVLLFIGSKMFKKIHWTDEHAGDGCILSSSNDPMSTTNAALSFNKFGSSTNTWYPELDFQIC